MARKIQTRTHTQGRRVPTIKLKAGDISVAGRSVRDCKALANMANDLRKTAPTEYQAGPFRIKGGYKAFLLSLGGYCLYKGIGYAFSNLSRRRDNTKPNVESDKPAFLKSQKKESKVLTLNEIGSTCDSEAIPLMGDFFYSGDIAVLFSTTNKGKTIMGIQIAKDLAEGVASHLVPNSPEPKRQNVIYYNFEMREEQLKKRYFSNNPDAVYPENLEIHFCKSSITTIDELLKDIAVRAENIKTDTTIFIDTIKDVCPVFFANEADRVIDALRTISENAKEVNNVRISFLLLGQANKKKPWDPIELDDLSGSFNFAGLVDSVFAIGNTNMGKSVRMLKMLKGRNDGIREKVILLKIETSTYLHFESFDEVDECDVLPDPPKRRKGGRTVLSSAPQKLNETPKTIPDEVLKEMRMMYQKGVNGRGAKSVLKKYGAQYGLRHAMQITRLMEKYDAQQVNTSG